MQTIGDIIEYIIDLSIDKLDGSSLQAEGIRKKILQKDEVRQVWNRVIEPKKVSKQKASQPLPKITTDEYNILRIVAEVHNVSIGDIISPGRKREIVDARMQAMVIFYSYLFYTFSRTGRLFGRDHSTVIHAVNTTNDLFETDQLFAKNFTQIIGRITMELPHLFETHEKLNYKYSQIFENRKKVSGAKIHYIDRQAKSFIQDIEEQKHKITQSIINALEYKNDEIN